MTDLSTPSGRYLAVISEGLTLENVFGYRVFMENGVITHIGSDGNRQDASHVLVDDTLGWIIYEPEKPTIAERLMEFVNNQANIAAVRVNGFGGGKGTEFRPNPQGGGWCAADLSVVKSALETEEMEGFNISVEFLYSREGAGDSAS